MPIEKTPRKTQDIFISDSFRQLLEKFESESVIAKRLLHHRLDVELLADDFVNFISISDSDSSKISYLTAPRIEQLKSDPKNDFWTTSKRFHCKPGAFVTKMFKDVSYSDVDVFATLYKAFSIKHHYEFKVVTGTELVKFYNQSHYASSDGSLGNSCMRYSRCRNYFDFYLDNPQVKMLIMKSISGDCIFGRALLWDLPSHNIMDRIYATNDEVLQPHFKKWAKENGYLYKTQQNWGTTSVFESSTETIELKIDIKLEKSDYEFYPYLDTFKWLDLTSGTLSNYKPAHFTQNDRKFKLLSNPDGQFNPMDSLNYDMIDRQWRYSSELICYDGVNFTSDKNLNYSETLGVWMLKSESVYDKLIFDFVYLDDVRNNQELILERRRLLQESLDLESLMEQKKLQSTFVDYLLNNA